MLMYGPHLPGKPWTGGAPTAWLDSNVMNEFATLVDLTREWSRAVLFGASAHFEYKRLRLRGTWWLLMALDQLKAITLVLGDESLPWMLANATGDDASERWLTLVHGFVKQRIVPGWQYVNLAGARLGGHKRNDTVIVEDAARRGIPILTRDRGLVKKATDRRVQAMAPEEYARTVMSLSDARLRFFRRYEARALRWCYRVVPGGVDWSSTGKQCDGLKWGHPLFQFIWRDELVFSPPALL